MEHHPLGNGDLTNVSVWPLRLELRELTILSWVSFKAESFASTASSVYAILIADLICFWVAGERQGVDFSFIWAFVDVCDLLP